MTNRPIKFRAWTNNNEWVYYTIRGLMEGYALGVLYHIDHSKTGQWTGLLDKNGKEIYELDRMTKRYGVLAHGTIYECVFHNGAFGYYPVGRSVAEHFTPFANSVNWHSFEVVGNAYEGDI